MKKQLLIFFSIIFFVFVSNAQTKCDVKAFFKSTEVDRDVMILTKRGEIEEAEFILSPTKLDVGKYKLTVSRKSSNLYKVERQDIFIETRYCYEYATYHDVILIVENNYGYNKGEIVF